VHSNHSLAASTPASIATNHAQASQVSHLIPVPTRDQIYDSTEAVVSRSSLDDWVITVEVIEPADLIADHHTRGNSITGAHADLIVAISGLDLKPVNLRSLIVVSTTSDLSVPGALGAMVEI
jgi:hypothetical protein